MCVYYVHMGYTLSDMGGANPLDLSTNQWQKLIFCIELYKDKIPLNKIHKWNQTDQWARIKFWENDTNGRKDRDFTLYMPSSIWQLKV